MSSLPVPPAHQAYLWIGDRNDLIMRAEQYLKQVWCHARGCGKCSICNQVMSRQYHLLCWLAPEKQTYTVDQIEELQHRVSFALEPSEHFFVVFERADALMSATANKLLKLVEEPPVGYHFLFLSPSVDVLLPTIVSRCVVTTFTTQSILNLDRERFVSMLLDAKQNDLSVLYQQYEKLAFNETETRVFLDSLLERALEDYTEAIKKNGDQQVSADRLFALINLIQKSFEQLPMPGSAKLFWRMFITQRVMLFS